MERQFASVLAVLVIALSTSGVVQAEVVEAVTDDFNEPHDYLLEGVWGTIWDDFVGYRECETVDELNASIDRAGQLYIESTNGTWAPPWCPLGPFLYKEVEGDFIARVKVSEYAYTPDDQLGGYLHNNCGLMARAAIDPCDEAGTGEDWVAIDYFPIWYCGNFVRVADNNEYFEPCYNGKYRRLPDTLWPEVELCDPYLQLERSGNIFIFRTSADGNNWEEMVCSPIARDDFDGLAVQVGLHQCTFSENTGYAAFDNFKLEAIAVYKAYNPVPGDEAVNQDPNVDLDWIPGDEAVTHDVYFGTDETAVLNASRPAGDVDGDGNVDWPDVFVVSQQWLQDPPSGSQPSADLNGDDNVNGSDFAIVAGDWTKQASDVFKGNQDNNSYYPGPLNYGTTYYWRIDEVNTSEPGSPWTGDVWSFTVLPLTAYNPGPPDEAKYVDVNDDLSWSPGVTAAYHDVYLGTVFNDVNDANRDNPLGVLKSLGQSGTTYEPGTLAFDTTYYWRIDEIKFPDIYRGDVWSFRTMPHIPITDPNLLGWWRLDEGTGSMYAVDWSGHEYHGTLVGPQWVASGPQGSYGALEFDGKDDYVELPIGEDIDSLTDSTFMVWLNSAFGGQWVKAFDFGTDDPNVYMCLGPRWYFMDEMYFAITTTDTLAAPNLVITTGFDFPPDEWHHVAVTIDADANTFTLYYDGMEVAQAVDTTLTPSALGETTNNWLGRSHDVNDDYYLGSMADFRIYDYAITQEEVIEVIGELTQDSAYSPQPGDGSMTDVIRK